MLVCKDLMIVSQKIPWLIKQQIICGHLFGSFIA